MTSNQVFGNRKFRYASLAIFFISIVWGVSAYAFSDSTPLRTGLIVGVVFFVVGELVLYSALKFNRTR